AGGLFWIDWYGGPMPVGLIPSAAGLNAALLTLIALCCGANLRARMRGVVKSSIVDNIREL
ncbi:MAG: hypothetical protein GX558_04880, partial [Clostridiales bacterium]|nr:hypothetical protein [Clostridiales bacterium]